VLLLSSLFFVSAQEEGFEFEFFESEEKIYSEATLEDDFDGSSVLVVMDKNVGGINKLHDEIFFGDFPKEYIKDLTELTVDIEEALIDEENFRQILQIKLPENNKDNVLSVIQQLERIEGIKYAGPNYVYYPGATIPNDTYYLSQWGLVNIKAADAWDITQGSSTVKVGIIDTGIASHLDLNGNLDDGWNFVNDTDSTDDTDGHGTLVAGIVGAVGNNGIGISGVAWNVKLVPLKISGSTVEVISAINYAKNNGIPILNFSWWNFPYDGAFLNAITGYSGLFVCIAGNADKDIDNTPNYPGSYIVNNIITVGASNNNNTKWVDSNYGATAVDLFAPGENIISTFPPNKTPLYFNVSGYDIYSGTSLAAPHVAGVAALIKAMHPGGISTSAIKAAIISRVCL